jgi:signal transduction histidine kinase
MRPRLLLADDHKIVLDGRGFDAATSTPGLGLASMEERVRLLGGQWTLRTAQGAGTEIRARFRG